MELHIVQQRRRSEYRVLRGDYYRQNDIFLFLRYCFTCSTPTELWFELKTAQLSTFATWVSSALVERHHASLAIARKCTFWRLLRTCRLHPLGRCQAPREFLTYCRPRPIITPDIANLGSFWEFHWQESDNGFVNFQKHGLKKKHLKTKPKTVWCSNPKPPQDQPAVFDYWL